MAQREFDIIIGPSGKVELQVQGYKGKRCLEVMKIFQELVGEVQSQELTSEYYAPEEDVRIRVDRQH